MVTTKNYDLDQSLSADKDADGGKSGSKKSTRERVQSEQD